MQSQKVNTACQEAKYRLLFYCTQAVSKSQCQIQHYQGSWSACGTHAPLTAVGGIRYYCMYAHEEMGNHPGRNLLESQRWLCWQNVKLYNYAIIVSTGTGTDKFYMWMSSIFVATLIHSQVVTLVLHILNVTNAHSCHTGWSCCQACYTWFCVGNEPLLGALTAVWGKVQGTFS